jgi:hypothetical protein
MTQRRRIARTVTLALLVVFIVVGMAGGCNACRRPVAPNALERELLRAPPLPYAVIVKPWDPETAARISRNPLAYAEGLAGVLIPSGAFRTSRFEKNGQATNGDLIATSTGSYCNSAVIPLLTILSLGIIPTVFDDEDCVGMELRQPGVPPSTRSVRIEFRNKRRVVMGWAAVFVGILPDWSHGSPRRDSRFYQRFRLEILRHRSEIERLIRQ